MVPDPVVSPFPGVQIKIINSLSFGGFISLFSDPFSLITYLIVSRIEAVMETWIEDVQN